MSYEWQRSHNRPDFTRKGNDTGGGRLHWLVIVLAALGLFVLVSAFSSGPVSGDRPAGAETGAADT